MNNLKIRYPHLVFPAFMSILLAGCNIKTGTMKNDDVRKIERTIGKISAFDVAGFSSVDFIKSDSDMVKVFGTEEELLAITIDTTGEKLVLKSMQGDKHPNRKLVAKIYTSNLTYLNATAIGSLKLPPVVNPLENHLKISAVASVEIDMDVEKTDCSIQSAASVVLKGRSGSGTISLLGLASLDMTGFKTGDTKVSQAGVAVSSAN